MKLKTLAAAGLALAVSAATSAAFAYPAVATSPVNVRSGPGTYFAIVDSLHRGQTVDIQRCTGGFCYVNKGGPDGWVSSRYLAAGPAYDDGYYNDDYYDDGYSYYPPPPPPRRPYPPRYGYGNNWNNNYNNGPGFSFCTNGSNAQFCFSN